MEKSTKSLRRVLEVSANLGIVIVALIIVGNFVVSKWRTKRQIDTLAARSKVSLSGVKWEDGSTLVLALFDAEITEVRKERRERLFKLSHHQLLICY
jgi:predicted ferric reductase